MRIQKPTAVLSIAAALVLGGLATALRAADPAHERHETMEQVGDALKPLVAVMKKETPFDADVVSKSAGSIAEHLKAASTMFPAGSEGGRARPEIWSNATGFEAAMKEAIAAAVALEAVKAEADFAPAFGAVAKSCKSCHERFRSAQK